MQKTSKYLGCLLSDGDVGVREVGGHEGGHGRPELVVGDEAGEVCEDDSLQELHDGELGLVAGGGAAAADHVEEGRDGPGWEDAD